MHRISFFWTERDVADSPLLIYLLVLTKDEEVDGEECHQVVAESERRRLIKICIKTIRSQVKTIKETKYPQFSWLSSISCFPREENWVRGDEIKTILVSSESVENTHEIKEASSRVCQSVNENFGVGCLFQLKTKFTL